jgi:hypothetical protein
VCFDDIDLDEDCIVYSFGLGDDWTFEREMAMRGGLNSERESLFLEGLKMEFLLGCGVQRHYSKPRHISIYLFHVAPTHCRAMKKC